MKGPQRSRLESKPLCSNYKRRGKAMANVEVDYNGTKLMVPEEVSKAVAKLPVDIRNSILGTYAAAAKKQGTSTITLKVTEKGGISVYGLAFIQENKASLVWVKGEAKGVGAPQ
jgi:hypothetical protein